MPIPPAVRPGPDTVTVAALGADGAEIARTLARIRPHADGSAWGVILPEVEGAVRYQWVWEGQRFEAR